MMYTAKFQFCILFIGHVIVLTSNQKLEDNFELVAIPICMLKVSW